MKAELIYISKWFLRVLWVILLFALIYIKVMGITRCMVKGQSMYPTLEENEHLLISKKKKPERFDLLVFNKDDDVLIKRVIGLPGDEIVVTDGVIVINGKKIDEPYIDSSLNKEFRDSSFYVKVANDAYYVLGDNRDHSVDSRTFGQINKNQIIGVPLCRLNLKKGLEKKDEVNS